MLLRFFFNLQVLIRCLLQLVGLKRSSYEYFLFRVQNKQEHLGIRWRRREVLNGISPALEHVLNSEPLCQVSCFFDELFPILRSSRNGWAFFPQSDRTTHQ